ncbi:hypothetical protein BW723_05025 [Polaribacter reichenbachii]|uniref:Uncharacterized protein n=1 Tax=Polaribacter reichenbachii TaxID=996801 RepID=A0A1B8TUX2_9FLAO|nr:hypothetical protein [Polaribacter reichenbachii]APZ45699.1 hypothetical protein BW723_05025 [Polaribacter reichenbachii]AUC19561.1 hypothetical protein BTO17_13035 [Polaribacter reichenbachii]OBY63285.1 hypothetical protein LPB301_10685 [Polaribacter reichenbachii]
MKKYIIVIFVFTSLASYSQYNNGMRNQRQNQMMQTPDRAAKPDFKIERYLGIVVYDIEKAAKKSGVKLSSDQGKKFSSILTTYNKEIKDIRRINSFTLKSTKEMIDNYQKKVASSGDFSGQTKVRLEMANNLKPISDTLRKEDRALDTTMKTLLSEKQYKKWIKYNKKIYKVFPKEKQER